MNLLNKLTIKNLKLNKKRTVVTIIGIILSVALTTAVSSIYTSGIKSLINFEIYEKGNFHTAYYDVSPKDLPTFKNNRAIETYYITKNIGYAKIASKNEYKPYAYVKAFTKSALENLSIKLVNGRLPQNENEILIPTHLKTNGRLTLNIGDTITLNMGKRISQDNYELSQTNPYQYDEIFESTSFKTYTIVGIIERPASNIEEYSAPGFTFVTFMPDTNITDNIDLYVKYTKDGVKNAYQVTAGILGVDQELFTKYYNATATYDEVVKYNNEELPKEKYKININSYLITLQTNPIKESGIEGLGQIVCVVLAIIVFTSIFCIKNSFDISITEKIKQYGMLRSVGATKKQIKKNVFYEATILGLIGIPLGILSGFLASYILIIVSNYFLNGVISHGLKLVFTFSIYAVLIAIILGIITLYFSAFQSARRASKISPIESIRNSANIKIKHQKIKSSKLIKKLFGIGGEISFKNLKRNKKKYRTTVLSLVISVFVFIALSSFMDLAFDSVKNELNISEYNLNLITNNIEANNYLNYLATTTLNNIEEYSVIRSKDIVLKNPKYNPAYLNWINSDTVDLEENYSSFYTLGKEPYQKYLKSLGLKYEDMQDKVIIADYGKSTRQINDKYESQYFHLYSYQKGDIINIKINDTDSIETNNEYLSLEVGFVTKEQPFGLKNTNSTKIIISDELFDKLTKTNHLEIYYKSNNATVLQDDIDATLKGETYTLNNLEENVTMMNKLFTLIGIFLYGFIIVITLIGITNIFNTITTNMELRKPEFAMLKSIGMTTYEFNRMIRLETVFMGAKTLLFGLPIGLGLSYLMYYLLGKNSGLSYHLPTLAIVIAILAVFVLISLIMKYSLNKINKQNTIETIRNENI